ncbi:centromere kinetochore component CENP-T-domain-containing protein [Xylariales sp. PMI_506]|nr:centromere kinetochore component CENP-T-domain-containing protein [Xylariales sp. PMI_506]
MASRIPVPNRGHSLVPPSTPGATAATPNNRRAASAEPLSARLSASARRSTVATPHARAAIRAMDQRRAAILTPGRARRRSLRDQRETPRDVLRTLARVLAPTSQTLHSSSSSSPGSANVDATLQTVQEADEYDDDDDDFPIERPRFSLPLQEDDDDDSDLKIPRSSMLEEDNYTAQSIELPRRDAQMNRFDRGSLGSVRYSDYAGPDVRSDDFGIDAAFFPPPALDDDSGGVILEEADVFERLGPEEARRQGTLGRDSVFGPIEIPEAGNESTFIMQPVESPVRDPTVVEDFAEDDFSDNEPLPDIASPVEPFDLPALQEAEEGHDETMDTTILSRTAGLASRPHARRAKTGKKMSKYGIVYSSLPPGVVKRLASTFARTAGLGKAKISPDTMDVIMRASDWFFEQLSDDLSAYAKHAGRRTIDESDVITLMRRQRQTSKSTTPFALAQRHLPRELLQELRMPVPPPSKAPRKKSRLVGAGEEDVT